MAPSKKRVTVTVPKSSMESPSTTAQPIEASIMAPPLRPYNPMRRGVFNILRHKDQPASIPKKPDLDKLTMTTMPKDQTAVAAPSAATDQYAKMLEKDPFMDFNLWKAEYNNQLSLADFKSMRDIIQAQEKTSKVEDFASISSDTPRDQLKMPTKTAISSKGTSKRST